MPEEQQNIIFGAYESAAISAGIQSKAIQLRGVGLYSSILQCLHLTHT
jgi:hypothetical protein